MITKFTAEALNRVRSLLTKEIKSELTKKKLKATGNLIKSISGAVFRKGDTTNLEIYAASYFPEVEFGTKKRDELPKISAIKAWAEVKGLQPKVKGKGGSLEDIDSMVYRIAERIRDFGTIKRFGNVGPAGAKIIDYIDKKYTQRITKEISEGYLKDLEVELDKNTK